MIILDIVRTSTRYKIETIVFKGQRYMQIAKLFKSSVRLDGEEEDKWIYQTSLLLDYEATQQVIEVFQSEDMTDKLLAELEKEVK